MTLLEQVIIDRHIGNDWDYLSLIEAVIERIEDIENLKEDELYDKLIDAVNDEIIYYRDQWTILQENCTPQEANWEFAIDTFISESYEVLEYYRIALQERRKILQWENVNYI